MGVGACLCLCCWGFLCCVVSCVCVCVCVCLGPSLVRGLSIEPLIPQGGIPHPRVQGEATPQRALAPPGEWPPLRVCGVFSRGCTLGQPSGEPRGVLNMMVSHAPPPVANFGSRSPGNPFLFA